MRKKVYLFITVFALIMVTMPYHTIARKIDHNRFIHFILSRTEISNRDIMLQRQKLLNLYHQFVIGKNFDKAQNTWLNDLANQYKLKSFDSLSVTDWRTLISRVDIIPNSLVLAQAINESAWGTSRFATKGNNYFGQWCFTQGCGLVPKRRSAGETFEVATYPSAMASIRAYMSNLNTNPVYKLFRTQRHLLRLAGEPLYGLNLAGSLINYSTRRQQYVNMIRGVINNYDLAKYDTVNSASKKQSDFFNWF